MSDNEKDRFGAKLHDLEKAREDLYFAEQERAQIAKLRARKEQEAQQGAARCPSCGARLAALEPSTDLAATVCPNGHGAWISVRELAALAEKASLTDLATRLDRVGRN